MEIILVVVILVSITVILRFALFDENYEYKRKSKKKKKKKKKKDIKATLAEYIRDSGSTITVKKLRTVQVLVGILFGIYGWVGTGWIFGFIPGYLIGSYLSLLPIKMAASHKNASWDEQILMFVQNMIQEIPLNAGSMSASISNSLNIISNPLRGKLISILAEYNSGQATLEEGFERLYRTSNKHSFLLISEAISTSTDIGTTAATDSFDHVYNIIRRDRSTRIERRKQLGQYAVFVRILLIGALATPLLLKIFFASAYETADGIVTKICLTIGFFAIWGIFKTVDKLSSSGDLT